MRSSSFGLVLFLVLSGSACRIEPKAQNIFEDDSVPAQTATRDWNGEAITIRNEGMDDGVNDRAELGGIELRVSAAATRVSVEAVFAAHADPDKGGNAGLSIADAKKTLAITETATSFDVTCGHGDTHGTSRAAGSGCKILRVTIPVGTAAQPHALVVVSGSGFVRVGLADAPPYVGALRVENKGIDAIEVRVRPVKDAMLTIAGENAVALAVPAEFSARSVVFSLAEATSSEIAPDFVTTDFAGMTSGAAYPVSGPTADAIRELTIASKGPLAAATIRISKL